MTGSCGVPSTGDRADRGYIGTHRGIPQAFTELEGSGGGGGGGVPKTRLTISGP